MGESGTVESTLNFLMRCERGRRSFHIVLAKVRLFDYVSMQRSSSPTVSRRIVAQGELVTTPSDDPVFVDAHPIATLPIEVMLQFVPAARYAEGRRALGRLEYLLPRSQESSPGTQSPRLSLELLLPVELASRFTDRGRTPMISVDVSGIESSVLDGPSGKGTHLWDTSTSPSLVVERCIVLDPEQ